MAFCPKCKVEYREGFEYCYDCNVYLVENLEDCEEKSSSEELNEDWAFLENLPTKEADLIEGVFELHEIKLLKKFEGSGEMLNLYMGDSFTGVNLYVPSRRLEEAQEIIENMKNSQFGEEDGTIEFTEDYEEDSLVSDKEKGSMIIPFLALLCIIAFIVVFLFN